MRRLSTLFGAIVLLVGLGVPIAHAGPLAACPATDWPMFGHDPGRSFASPDRCAGPVAAATLRPSWFFNTHSPVTAQPAVVHGVLYAGTFDGKFYALHAGTGKAAWAQPFDVNRYDTSVTDFGKIPNSAAVTTVGGRSVVVFGGGATLFALDAESGALLSKLCLDRVDPTCHNGSGRTIEIEASPAVVPHGADVQILVGTDVNENDPSGPAGLYSVLLGASGTLTPQWMFDPETGATVAGLPPLDPAQSEHGCNDVWSSPAVDTTSRAVVFGVGNCNHPEEVAPSAIALVESTIALDLDTGAVRWQAAPNAVDNGLDLDFGATPNIMGDAVGEGGKDGNYYVYDLRTGALRWKTKAATASSLGGMIGSTAVGQMNGHGAVFATSAIPVSPNDPQGSIQNDLHHPKQAFGVHGIDTVTHTVAWDAPVGPVFGAAVYAHGVVFAPVTTMDALVLFAADTGVILRTQPLNAPPSSPVAVVGDRVFIGSGTTENTPPLSAIGSLGGIWGFQFTVG
jgi:polyvinyl alcohol dehydrogenase (cytochrome)